MKKKFNMVDWLLEGLSDGFQSVLQFVIGLIAAAVAQEGFGLGPGATLVVALGVLVLLNLGVAFWALYMSDEGEEDA